tara:strand:+ start:125 stop:661 length:537 start_codon:yes stop_codon:yes gene_type:complete
MTVDKQYIKDQLAKLDSKRRLGVGKELNHLHEVINEGENILGHTRGFYDGNTWLICVTNRRLLFLDKGMLVGMKSTEIPLDSVGSVNYETKMLGGNITVTASGQEKHIGKMRKQDVKDVANLISEAAAKMKKEIHGNPGGGQESNTSKMDELKKLAELKDSGVLSEEEFNAEKAKLLS